jgi:hypothetical protein
MISKALSQLGAPDTEIKDTFTSWDGALIRTWVWVDGDVRVSLETREGLGGRILEMKVVDFPEKIKAASRSKDGAVLVEQAEEEWGVKKKQQPTSTAPLPRTLANLALGMAKAQILAVHPDAEMDGRYGSLRMEKGNELDFYYNERDDTLYEVSLT